MATDPARLAEALRYQEQQARLYPNYATNTFSAPYQGWEDQPLQPMFFSDVIPYGIEEASGSKLAGLLSGILVPSGSLVATAKLSSLAAKAATPAINKTLNVPQRYINAPVVATEVTSPTSLQNAHRFKNTGLLNPDRLGERYTDEAFENIGGLLSPTSQKGQGAWAAGDDLEFNRTYVQAVKGLLGNVESKTQRLSDVAKVGKALDQAGMGVIRFNPHAINDSRGANALSIKLRAGIKGEEDVVSIAKTLKDMPGMGGVVVQHRPRSTEAVLFDPDGKLLVDDIVSGLRQSSPNSKIVFGRSDNGVDRVYLTREPPWWDDGYRPKGVFSYDDLLK